MDKNKDIYMVKITDENYYYNSMRNLFDFMNIKKDGAIGKICIKINLCDYRLPSSGATTDPQILDALLKLLREKFPKADIFIIENDASGTCADNLFPLIGIDEVCNKYGCETKNLAKDGWITKKIDGLYFDEIEVPLIVEESDLVINHPKLKTHSFTKVSIGLKNMYGCLHDKYKVKYHYKLDDVIVDINKAIKSDYIIVDGNIGLEGFGGPAYGIPKKCGLLMGGKNVVSIDAFCARLMGFNPLFVSHIRKAHKNKLGSMNYKLHNGIPDFNSGDYKFKFNRLQYYLLKMFQRELNL